MARLVDRVMTGLRKIRGGDEIVSLSPLIVRPRASSAEPSAAPPVPDNTTSAAIQVRRPR